MGASVEASELLEDVWNRITEYGRGNHAPAVSDEGLARAVALWNLSIMPSGEMEVRAAFGVAMIHWCRYKDLPYRQSREDFLFAVQIFAELFDAVGPGLPASATPYVKVMQARTAEAALGTIFRAVRSGDDAALDVGIFSINQMITQTEQDHPDLPAWYGALGSALLARHEKFDAISDLDGAVTAFERAYALRAPDHPEQESILKGLAAIWAFRLHRIGELSALDWLIEVQVRQVAADPTDDLVAGLATSLTMQFQRSGALSDADEAVRLRRQLLARYPAAHPERWKFEADLAASMMIRQRNIHDLDDAIAVATSAERNAPDEASRVLVAGNLVEAYLRRYESSGDPRDLSAAIVKQRSIVDLREDADDIARLDELSHLRYRDGESLEDLCEAAELATQAASALTTPARRLWLCLVLRELYLRTDDNAVLDRAVEAAYACAAHVGGDEAEFRATQYAVAAIVLQYRYRHTNRLADIDEAIRLMRLALTEERDHPAALAGDTMIIGEFLMARFATSEDLADLRQAADAAEQAVAGTTERGLARARRLLNAAGAFRRLSDVTGSQQALSTAIALFGRAAKADDADEDPGRYFDQLGNALQTQYEWTGSAESLDRAVAAGQRAVELSPPGHSDRAGRLSNFGNALSYRFNLRGQADDASAAIEALEEAVEVADADDPALGMFHCNLADVLRSAYRKTRPPTMLDLAIQLARRGIELTDESVVEITSFRVNLAGALTERFRSAGMRADLDEAIDILCSVRQAASPRFGTAPANINLGAALVERYDLLYDERDATDAVTVLAEASRAQGVPASMRLSAARLQAHFTARTQGMTAASDVYCFAVSIALPDLAILGMTRPDQWRQIEQYVGSLGPDAAAVLLAARRTDEAVEIVERARNLVWAQLLDLNVDYARLRDVTPDLAWRLEKTAARIVRSHGGTFEPRIERATAGHGPV